MKAQLADELNIHMLVSGSRRCFGAFADFRSIGGGMGGMGCALALAKQGFTKITVWESAKEIGEVGAGINITPNLARILDRWGVLDIAKAEAVPLTGASVLSAPPSRQMLKLFKLTYRQIALRTRPSRRSISRTWKRNLGGLSRWVCLADGRE